MGNIRPNIATVDGGVVTGVNAGTVTITATSTDGTNVSGSCDVTVNEPQPTLVQSIAVSGVLP